jgi:uncharacterized protein YdiU (UPF0061 family)
MSAKLGLTAATDDDQSLWTGLLDVLAATRADYALAFRALGTFSTAAGADNKAIRRLFNDPKPFDEWAGRYRDRLRAESSSDADRKARMDHVNPKYILRNYLAQIAIDQSQRRNYSEVDRLRGVLRLPFDEQSEMEHYARPAPEWGKRLVVSCSS